MSPSRTIISAVIALLVPLGAAAQIDKPAGTPPQPAAVQPKAASDARPGHWFASGFAGSNFGHNAQPASPGFGGSVGYLMRDRLGAEFNFDISPDFEMQNNPYGEDVRPTVNAYMFNAVLAVPIGAEREWQPYASAGAGAMTLRSGLVPNGSTNAFDPDDSRFGVNAGGGVMGFLGSWGFKADIRFFRAEGTYSPTSVAVTSPTPSPLPPALSNSTANSVANGTLAGLHYWRANAGIVLRW